MSEGERRLAAIMFTDIAGYTSLAQRNEKLALELLEEYRSLLRGCLLKHEGREVKTMGDGFLIEFPSALEAVNCALSIQKVSYKSNAERPSDRRITLRIGVHLGDVVHRDGDIYGDAVNVASRIEPLANPGEILITQQVYDHVRNKLESPIGYLGRHNVKNVDLPIEVYKVAVAISESRPVIPVVPFATRNRLAVLPFVSISTEPTDDYLADGLTEELISVVSKVSGLRIISRTSVMKYKGSRRSVGDIAQDLNVGTVLEGSIRKASNKLRITVQLIDVYRDEHIWSQSYDRELKDVFEIQSDIAQRVAEALKVHLLAAEKQLIEKKPTEDIEAYTAYLKGLHLRGEGTLESIERAILSLENAISKDPTFALALAALADCYATLAVDGHSPPKEAFPKAKYYATRAIELDGTIPEAHATLGLVLEAFYLDQQGAEEEFEKALGLNPSYGRVCRSYGVHLACMGRLDEAVSEIRRALELNPLGVDVNECAAAIFNCADRFEEAVNACRRMLDLNPNHFPALVFLAETYINKSMFSEAIQTLQKALIISNGTPLVKGRLGYAYAKVGKKDEALAILQVLLRDSKQTYVTPIAIALIQCGLGNNTEALDWLGRAYVERPDALLSLKVRPIWSGLRPDRRFTKLLQDLGLEGKEEAHLRDA
jgi:adenylate cyclase